MLTKFVSKGSYSPEVRVLGTLITTTEVFRPAKSIEHDPSIGDPLPNLDFVPKQLQAHNKV